MKPPWLVTVTGGQPVGAAASTPASVSAATSGAIGRFCMWASPVSTVVPLILAAAAVRKRTAVPALPRNRGSADGVRTPVLSTWKSVSPVSVTVTPSCPRARAIYFVSSLFSAPLMRLTPRARAAISSTRLVMDFEPGRAILPLMPGWAPIVRDTSLTAVVWLGIMMGRLGA